MTKRAKYLTSGDIGSGIFIALGPIGWVLGLNLVAYALCSAALVLELVEGL